MAEYLQRMEELALINLQNLKDLRFNGLLRVFNS
jgi:hypothetical protein